MLQLFRLDIDHHHPVPVSVEELLAIPVPSIRLMRELKEWTQKELVERHPGTLMFPDYVRAE